MPEIGEYVLPPPSERTRIPHVTELRSTWVTGSIRALQTRGLLDRYTEHLSVKDRTALVYCVPGSWLSAALVMRHYEACDRLALSTATLLEVGSEVTRRIHGPALALGRSVASASGVTPWTILGRLDKLWGRVTKGGAVVVARLGPKEARVEVIGLPVARLRYNRIATAGIVRGVVQLFCRSTWVHELPAICTSTTLGYNLQWA